MSASNPLNIRGSKIIWLGQEGLHPNGMVRFSDPVLGGRAGVMTLLNHLKRGGTLSELERSYLGPEDANRGTGRYAATIARVSGFTPNEQLYKRVTTNEDDLVRLLRGVQTAESARGDHLTDDQWRRAIRSANAYRAAREQGLSDAEAMQRSRAAAFAPNITVPAPATPPSTPPTQQPPQTWDIPIRIPATPAQAHVGGPVRVLLPLRQNVAQDSLSNGAVGA